MQRIETASFCVPAKTSSACAGGPFGSLLEIATLQCDAVVMRYWNIEKNCLSQIDVPAEAWWCPKLPGTDVGAP